MKKRIGIYFLFICIFFLSGCSTEPQEVSFTETDVTDSGAIYVDYEHRSYMNSLNSSAGRHHSLPVKIMSEDTELEYYFHVEDRGLVLTGQDYSTYTRIDPEQAVRVGTGEAVQWTELCIQEDSDVFFYQGITWMDIRIEKEGNIVGYAVLKLELKENSGPRGDVIRHAEFPLIDGEYQPVTVEYVESRIEKLKQEAGGTETETGSTAEAETIDGSSIVWQETGGDISVEKGYIELDAADEEVEYWFTTDESILLLEGDPIPGYAMENDADGYHAPLICSEKVSRVRMIKGVYVFEGTRCYRMWRGERTYNNVVMYKDGHIVGYAVIERRFPKESKAEITLLKEVEFPQVDGVYQNVPEAYVWAEIEKVKQENESVGAEK